MQLWFEIVDFIELQPRNIPKLTKFISTETNMDYKNYDKLETKL